MLSVVFSRCALVCGVLLFPFSRFTFLVVWLLIMVSCFACLACCLVLFCVCCLVLSFVLGSCSLLLVIVCCVIFAGCCALVDEC